MVLFCFGGKATLFIDSLPWVFLSNRKVSLSTTPLVWFFPWVALGLCCVTVFSEILGIQKWSLDQLYQASSFWNVFLFFSVCKMASSFLSSFLSSTTLPHRVDSNLFSGSGRLTALRWPPGLSPMLLQPIDCITRRTISPRFHICFLTVCCLIIEALPQISILSSSVMAAQRLADLPDPFKLSCSRIPRQCTLVSPTVNCCCWNTIDDTVELYWKHMHYIYKEISIQSKYWCVFSFYDCLTKTEQENKGAVVWSWIASLMYFGEQYHVNPTEKEQEMESNGKSHPAWWGEARNTVLKCVIERNPSYSQKGCGGQRLEGLHFLSLWQLLRQRIYGKLQEMTQERSKVSNESSGF